jgi:DNA-binding MarR family transcriptional regulator
MATSIQREIRQTRPFPSLQEQVTVNLIRTSAAVMEQWRAHLKKAEGLSASQYNILRILRGARPDSLRVSEVAERMLTRDPDMTRLMDRLVRRGYLHRDRDVADRRVVRVGITRDGLTALNRLDGALETHVHASMAGLRPTQLKALDTLLNDLRAGISTPPS